jgi:hypothetical protein
MFDHDASARPSHGRENRIETLVEFTWHAGLLGVCLLFSYEAPPDKGEAEKP